MFVRERLRHTRGIPLHIFFCFWGNHLAKLRLKFVAQLDGLKLAIFYKKIGNRTLIIRLPPRIFSPTHKRTEGRAPVRGSKFTSKDAAIQGGSA